jgi:2-phosphosulfolactate phosphatase
MTDDPSPAVGFEWGTVGARALTTEASLVVVVDVLSFCTAVSVAVSRGTAVLPHPWGDESANEVARERDAVLAVGRRGISEQHPWSVSPAALLAAPPITRLLLPSPNGSTVSAVAGGPVVAGCLRNAGAVATWLLANGWATPQHPVVVVAAGERWPDGSLRPAVEDLLGAGAVVAALAVGGADLSAEAQVARAAYLGTHDIAGVVRTAISGRELVDSGFGDDVAVATQVGADLTVPLLQSGAFTSVA